MPTAGTKVSGLPDAALNDGDLFYVVDLERAAGDRACQTTVAALRTAVLEGADLSAYETAADHDSDLAGYATTGALTSGLATKAATSHAHAIADVTSLQAGLDAKMANPMTTAADLIVGGAAGAPARLAKGAALQVLRMNAGATAQEYADPAGGVPEARVLAINTTKVDAALNTTTTNFLSYTVDLTPSDWIALGLMYRAVLTGRCTNTSGAGRTLDIGLGINGVGVLTIRLPVAVTTSPNCIPWSAEFLVSTYADDSLWLNGTAYLGSIFNQTTALVDTAGAVYAGSKSTTAVLTTGGSTGVLATTYKRDSAVSTFVVSLANSFIQQIKV